MCCESTLNSTSTFNPMNYSANDQQYYKHIQPRHRPFYLSLTLTAREPTLVVRI